MTTHVLTQPYTAATNIRIVQLDVLRGFAVLGIYWINLLIFALPYHSIAMPTLSGIADQANIATWAFGEIFIEGTMRGLFSLLFGASAMIFLDEARLTSSGISVVDRYYRRTLLLILFGIIHAYFLLWPYDVLYAYGLLGLFLFPIRKLPTILLVILSCLLLLIGDLDNRYLVDDEQGGSNNRVSIQDTINALRTHPPAVPKKPDEPSNSYIDDDEDIALYRSSYHNIFTQQFKIVVEQQSTLMYTAHFFDIGGMMLMGMVLLRLGILSGQRTKRFYLLLALSGYILGILVRGVGVYISILDGFDALLVSKDVDISYNLGRLPLTLGHIGLIGLLCQTSWLGWIQSRLAAVGRLALTNYIMQTVISIFIFYGFGFGLFATLERYQLIFVGLAVWGGQILFSVTWLRFYRLGPLEWLWRSLIYGSRQPLRRTGEISQH